MSSCAVVLTKHGGNVDDASGANVSDTTRLLSAGYAVAVALGVLCVLVATSEMLSLTWDEGESIDRARTILDGTAPENWPFTIRNEGHPAGYALVIAAGKSIASVAPSCCPPKTAWRFGPMLLAATAFGAVFYRLARRYDYRTGLFAIAAMLLLPRLFTHWHVAACDGPLCAAWLLAWSATDPARRSYRCAILLGLLLGLTASMKFPGLLAFVPAAIAILFPGRDGTIFRNSFRNTFRNTFPNRTITLCLVAFAGAISFFLLNPPLWNAPCSGVREYVALNTHREGYNVATLFLGRMYDLHHPLPWYNTLVWTAITVPVVLLFYACLGAWKCWRFRRGASILLPMLLMLLVRALPYAPPHDGVRLFLPAFPFLAILAGIGAAWAGTRNGPDSGVEEKPSDNTPASRSRRIPRIIAASLFLLSTVNLFLYAPQWLSYYNVLIGGLPGATRAGMEPTYWWDGLDRETLDWINANTPPGEAVRFSAFSRKTLQLYHEWGDLEPPVARPDEHYAYYVLQRRPSAEFPFDKEWIDEAEPVHVKRLFGVPLIEIYRTETP